MDRSEAQDALAAVAQAQGRLAQAVATPWWRHLAFAAIMAGFVLGVTVPESLFVPVFVTTMAATVWLVRDDRRRHGLFVNGFRRGRTLPISVGLLLGLLLLVKFAIPARHLPFPSLLAMGCIALAFGLALAASLMFERVYRADLNGARR